MKQRVPTQQCRLVARTISKPAISFLKSTVSKPSTKSSFSAQSTRLSPSPFSRPSPEMASYAPISLSSPLGIVVGTRLGLPLVVGRSLSQGMLSSANPGV